MTGPSAEGQTHMTTIGHGSGGLGYQVDTDNAPS